MQLPVWLIALLLILLTSTVPIEFTDEMIRRYREKVRNMFYHAYNGYLDYAYPLDELKPISCVGVDTWGSFSLSLIDALDTLLVMGNATEFKRAVDLVLKSVKTDANVNVSVFETNIRVIGGLISAHMLGGRVQGMPLEDGWPCSGPLLRLAEAMAARLLPAFNTDTGMPFGTVNLKYGVQKTETPVTCTAGVGTFILEFGALSRLTGDPQYERVALRALDALWNTRSPIGLVGNHINVQTGQWTATDSGIGAGVDSYFEYLVKGALLFQRPSLMQQFNEFTLAINEYVRKEDWFMWVTMQKGTVSLPIFQSLEAFWPGLLTMIGDVEDASRIMLQYSQTIRQYGFPPEFYNIPNSEVSDKRAAFPLRPEMAESLMYLYRATEDPQFLEIGAQIIDAIEHSAKTSCGYATINNVNEHSIEDRMESFFLAETTKYLYLLFDPKNFLHSDGTRARIIDTPNGECIIEAGGYIYNTEAHPIDPAILHCCSAQGQKERETVREWEDKIDLVAILSDINMGKSHKIEKADLSEDFFGLKKSQKSNYFIGQYGSDEVEYEIDNTLIENKLVGKGHLKKPKLVDELSPSSVQNVKHLNDSQRLVENNKSSEQTFKQTYSSKTVTVTNVQQHSSRGVEKILDQMRRLIREARLIDEKRSENGEQSNVAEKLIKSISKMYAEYADGIAKDMELKDMDFPELKRRIAKRQYVEGIPVVDADCEGCCFPIEYVGESVAHRLLMNAIYKAHIYPKRNVPFENGPVCRPRDMPSIEDNYRNIAPSFSDSSLPGDIPSNIFYHPPSFTNFEFEDITSLGFSLLSSPPISFNQKFTGLGQVTLQRNESWYH